VSTLAVSAILRGHAHDEDETFPQKILASGSRSGLFNALY
jgi:hypothetical protein